MANSDDIALGIMGGVVGLAVLGGIIYAAVGIGDAIVLGAAGLGAAVAASYGDLAGGLTTLGATIAPIVVPCLLIGAAVEFCRLKGPFKERLAERKAWRKLERRSEKERYDMEHAAALGRDKALKLRREAIRTRPARIADAAAAALDSKLLGEATLRVGDEIRVTDPDGLDSALKLRIEALARETPLDQPPREILTARLYQAEIGGLIPVADTPLFRRQAEELSASAKLLAARCYRAMTGSLLAGTGDAAPPRVWRPVLEPAVA